MCCYALTGMVSGGWIKRGDVPVLLATGTYGRVGVLLEG